MPRESVTIDFLEECSRMTRNRKVIRWFVFFSCGGIMLMFLSLFGRMDSGDVLNADIVNVNLINSERLSARGVNFDEVMLYKQKMEAMNNYNEFYLDDIINSIEEGNYYDELETDKDDMLIDIVQVYKAYAEMLKNDLWNGNMPIEDIIYDSDIIENDFENYDIKDNVMWYRGIEKLDTGNMNFYKNDYDSVIRNSGVINGEIASEILINDIILSDFESDNPGFRYNRQSDVEDTIVLMDGIVEDEIQNVGTEFEYSVSNNHQNQLLKTLLTKYLKPATASQISLSIPIEYWNLHQTNLENMFYDNASCAVFPNMYQIKFENIYWQLYKHHNITFHLYKAFYDTRRLNGLKPSVHILAMLDNVYPTEKSFCQIWFDHQTNPVIVETTMYKYIWFHEWGDPAEGELGPFMVTCEIPESHEMYQPSCVSLVQNFCDQATNLLAVVYNKPAKKDDFAVCVKGLDFYEEDISPRLIEWIEILRLMGADKIFFYKFHVHPNMEKVLDYYESLGWIDVAHITLPAGLPNIPILQHLYLVNNNLQQCFNEVLPYNDCFYRNVNSYKYITLLDLDEVIVPIEDTNWTTLMERVRYKAGYDNYASYNARNVYFLNDMTPEDAHPDIPPYMHILKHTERSEMYTPPYFFVKSFMDPEVILSVHNHMPLEHSWNHNLSYSMDTKDAQLNHYRQDCPSEINCTAYRSNVVSDYALWKYKDYLIVKTKSVLKTLGIEDVD